MGKGKLVRDKVPDIIRREGREPKTRTLSSPDEYRQALIDKLIEEAEEFRATLKEEEPWQIFEFADVMEVIYAIHTEFRWTREYIEKRRQRRRQERGGFSKRIYLEKLEG